MRRVLPLFLLVLIGANVSAQWVKYPHPGTPRTRDGKADLTAPTPRASNGKADLSGVWHVQPTGRAEMKRLFGDGVDTIEVPGMEIDTISKYAVNIFQDFNPTDAPRRPEVFEVLKRRGDTGIELLPLTHAYFCSENEKNRPRMGVK